MSLVNTLWLEENINKVKVIDSSWHMPQTNRNGHEEYKKEHIKNAIFFDLDKNSKQNTDLPHMLTDQESWSKIVSDMGINNDDEIVVYDNSEVISSCRCWYNFIYYGHDFNKVKVIDSSWHMPQTNRNGYEEYKKEHIKNAIFFDLDKNSKHNTDLPHMLTDQESWSQIVSDMGINNDDEIVVYDNSEVISSCRCWYNFIYYGHDFDKVHILDGGFEKWKLENKFTTNEIPLIKKTNYLSKENKNMVKNIDEINENIKTKSFTVVDARSKERFEGKVAEPRKNTRSGSIENSFCLPFKELINSDKTFIDKIEIHKKFTKINKEMNEKIVFSCGSGVTACVLALAYSLVNTKYTPTIYDGSWSEYGKI